MMTQGKNKQNYQNSSLVVAFFVQSGIIGTRDTMQRKERPEWNKVMPYIMP